MNDNMLLNYGMLKNNVTTSICERIIVYPYIRLEKDGVNFSDFSESCSKEWGGSPEDWGKTNKQLLGLFGSKKTKLKKGIKFKFPKSLVDDARERWFETVGVPNKNKSTSPVTVLNSSSPDSENSPEICETV